MLTDRERCPPLYSKSSPPHQPVTHSGLGKWGGGQVDGGRINTSTKPRDKYYNYCLLDGGRINTNTKPRDKYYNYHQGNKGPGQQ